MLVKISRKDAKTQRLIRAESYLVHCHRGLVLAFSYKLFLIKKQNDITYAK